MSRPEFEHFPKIPRLNREVIITEKIDGTNAGIFVDEDNTVHACSRNRWIVPGDDNAGFAVWAWKHAKELLGLGIGMHWGEWWGAGIQRRYGLDHKRFSLFNTGRWFQTDPTGCALNGTTEAPECCHVVPILTVGNFKEIDFDEQISLLARNGSIAAPGFMKPEGIVIYHVAARNYFKATIDKDSEYKSQSIADSQLKFPAHAVAPTKDAKFHECGKD